MSALHHSLPLLEVRSQAQGVIAGWGAVFNGVDTYGDTIAPGAFVASLAKHQAAGTVPAMLWSHQMASPIGRWLELAEDGRGLRVTGQLNLKTTAGQEALEHLRAGDVNGLSIGFLLPDGGTEHRSDGVRVLKRIDLHEVSVVSVPADNAARVSAVKSPRVRPATIRELEDALGELGYSRREARAVAAKGFPGLAQVDDSSDELLSAIKAATHLFSVKG